MLKLEARGQGQPAKQVIISGVPERKFQLTNKNQEEEEKKKNPHNG
jgi:hypothetical protein